MFDEIANEIQQAVLIILLLSLCYVGLMVTLDNIQKLELIMIAILDVLALVIMGTTWLLASFFRKINEPGTPPS